MVIAASCLHGCYLAVQQDLATIAQLTTTSCSKWAQTAVACRTSMWSQATLAEPCYWPSISGYSTTFGTNVYDFA